MLLFQRARLPEFCQVESFAEVFCESAATEEIERTGRSGLKQLRQLNPEQSADPDLERRKGRAAEMPADRRLLQPAQFDLVVDEPNSARMGGELLAQSLPGQEIDPDI